MLSQSIKKPYCRFDEAPRLFIGGPNSRFYLSTRRCWLLAFLPLPCRRAGACRSISIRYATDHHSSSTSKDTFRMWCQTDGRTYLFNAKLAGEEIWRIRRLIQRCVQIIGHAMLSVIKTLQINVPCWLIGFFIRFNPIRLMNLNSGT